MNFDRLAPHYHWLEKVFAGGLMQRCRTAHLGRVRDRRHALLAGEGTGRFLVELLRTNPQIQVTCVEGCAGMIAQARRRMRRAGLEEGRVHFQQADVRQWRPPAGSFDLVVTNFFLDCFRAEELHRLVPLLAGSATADAVWLLADFRVPARGWWRLRAQVILAALYAGFKLATALSASRLTPPEPLLTASGFKLMERRLFNGELAHADIWRREIETFQPTRLRAS